MIYDSITHQIIGCAMKVYNTLGNGFQEVIYQRALGVELQRNKIGYEREKEMIIFYEGVEVGTRRVDFFVEGIVLVELKAVNELDNVHLAQAANYCEAYNLPIGLLINFGSRNLEFKRVYNSKHPENKSYKK